MVCIAWHKYCQLDFDTVSGILEHTGEERITVYFLQMSMAADRPQSLKQRLAAPKNRFVLIGRTHQQDWFERSLLQPEHEDARIIFSISGQGGIGKTTLLREFRRIAEKHKAVCAYINEGVAMNPVNDVPEVMHRLVEDFEGQGFKFDKFRERYKAYRTKKQEIEADPEAPKGFVGDATRGMMKVGLEAAKGAIPFGGMIGGMIDSEMVATKAGELMNYGIDRFRNKDEERLIKETLEVLTPLFLEGINRVGGNTTVVLLLDTYEVTGAFLEAWILAFLNEEFGDIHFKPIVCIGGRNPLDRNVWTEWESCIARSPLEPFTEDEARQFLGQKGIVGEAVIAEIWRLSAGGLPLLVSMMALNAPMAANAVVDACDDAVTRFLKWEVDEAKKTLALDGALGRAIDGDVVLALGSELFDWLRGCPFVIREGSVWRYHSVVRELMVRFQWQKSRKHWTEVHGRLAGHYEAVRIGLGLESGKEAEDKEWRRLSLEWFYHSLCAERQAKLGMGLNGFLVALKESRGYALEWTEVMVMVGKETEWVEVREWGELLRNGMVAHHEKQYADAIPLVTRLLASPIIESKQKAVAFDWRGGCLRNSKQGDLGLQDFLKAVELDEEDPEYHFDLAYTYAELKRYEEAIGSYQKAIELNPENINVYNNLGHAYHVLNRHEEAIGVCQKIIELNPENADAYYSLGITYFALKRYEDAIDSSQKAIAIDPQYANAYYNLGRTYNELKRYEEAIGSYQKAIELNSEFVLAYHNLGNAYAELKRYEEAIGSYQKAIELNPEYATAYNNLGTTYAELKRYEEAIGSYQKAIELNPEYTDGLGLLQYNIGDFQSSLSTFQKFLELQPDRLMYLSNICYLHLLQGDLDKAEQVFEEIPNKDDFDRAWLNYGLIQSQRGNIKEAMQFWQNGVNLMQCDNEWDKAVHCVFTVALGNIPEGLQQIQNLISDGVDEFTLRNALNDAILILRSPHYPEGIEDMVQLLQTALSSMETI